MRHTPSVSVTSLPPNPRDERRDRMIKYSIAMGVRTLCVIACFFVHGAWLIIPVVGAIVLPYLAVTIANVGPPRTVPAVERPGGLVPLSNERR